MMMFVSEGCRRDVHMMVLGLQLFNFVLIVPSLFAAHIKSFQQNVLHSYDLVFKLIQL